MIGDGHNALASGVKEILQRTEAENLAKSSQEIILDDSNKVSFPGYPYVFEALGEKILVSIDIFKSGYECRECQGKKVVEIKQGRESVFETCPACKGVGATLVLPDTSKNLPTTGVVVSIGFKAKELINGNYKCGDRILFGPYSGNMIPTKAGLMFKVMDWNAPWTRIKGADDMGAFDFIVSAS
jgi:hypothetical protein